MSVVLETTIGDITVDLYLKERPNACLNFLKLCKIKYYNLCVFHKVERNFIAQTGDPTSTGRGGDSVFSHLYGEQAKYFEAELKPRLKHEKLGTLSMVNNGNNMNGSQFFLTLAENLTYLDEVHTVFGEVTEGFDILLKLNEVICDPSNNRPFQDIRITHTVVLHDPYDDPTALQIPNASPVPSRDMLETDYIAADEELDDTKGKNVEEIEEKIKESEAKARATILEMVGDLPDADVKPPENVLFVCKLNPVTTSEDLELIFSRFGTIVSCEVIKDKKSGESLQYAFIEFEKEEDCENAYFKMDNVLIDDRRIHVDFSQSVSKLNWEKGGNFLKGKSNKAQNFVIKGNEKKSDGYEMIFDMDNDSKQPRNERKEQGKSKSSSNKQHHSSMNVKSHERSHYDDFESCNQKQPSKSRSNYSKSSRQRLSKSPSPIKSSSFKRNARNHSKSPTRSQHSSKTSQQFSKPSRHDSSSSVSSDGHKDATNRKRKHSSPEHRYKKAVTYESEISHSTSKNNRSPLYHKPSRSYDSNYSKYPTSKHLPQQRSRSPTSSHKKRPSVSSSRSVSPIASYPSKRKSISSDSTRHHKDITKSKLSSQNRSQSKSPEHFKYVKNASSRDNSLKKSKHYKKHQTHKSSSHTSNSSNDSEAETNQYYTKSLKSKSTSSYRESTSSHKHSHKSKKHKRSSS